MKIVKQPKKISSVLLHGYMNFISLTVLLFLLIIIFLHSIVIKKYETEVATNSLSEFKASSSIIDDLFLTLNKTAIKMIGDTIFIGEKIKNSDYNKFQACRAIERYMPPIESLSNIYLYHVSNDNDVYSSKGIITKEIFESFINISKEKIESIYNYGIPVFTEEKTDRNIKYNLLIYPIPSGLIFFETNSNEIAKILKIANGGNNSEIMIVSIDDKILLSDLSSNKNVYMKLIANYTGQYGIFDDSLNGYNISLMKIASEYFPFDYYYIVNEGDFKASLYNFKAIMYGVLLTIFLISCALSVLFAIRTYKPVKDLSHKIVKDFMQISNARTLNEFEAIENTMDHMTSENEKLLSEIKQQNKIVQEQLIFSLFNGQIDFENNKGIELKIKTHLNFKHKNFIVCHILLDNFDDTDKNTNKMVLYRILESFENDTFKLYSALPIEANGYILLINFSSNNIKLDIHNILIDLQKKYTKKTSKTISIGVSMPDNDYNNLQTYLIQAKFLSAFRMINGWNSINFFEEIVSTRNCLLGVLSSIDNLQRLFIQGDFKTIEGIIHQKFSNMNKGTTPDHILNFYTKFVEVAISVCKEDVNDFNMIKLELNRLRKYKPETKDRAHKIIVNISKELCTLYIKQKESKNTILKDKVIYYMETNYPNNQITLSSISILMNCSASYLSRYFKDQTGETLMNYLDNIRIQKVKILLITKNKNIKDIILEVGYIDVNNFIRKFKKFEGITPSEYQKQF